MKDKKGGKFQVPETQVCLSVFRKVTSALGALLFPCGLMLPLLLCWGFCEMFLEHLTQSLAQSKILMIWVLTEC